MGRWESLPAEVRWMVLEMVARNYRFAPDQPYVRAGYARVCREWQLFFEQSNFQQLVLDKDRISDFKSFMATGERRNHLEHLSLRVRLNEYDCTVCQVKEDQETIRRYVNDDQHKLHLANFHRNNEIFSKDIWDLAAILSKWTKSTTARGQKGLTWQLGAYSPSDSKHTFKEFLFEVDYSIP